MKAFTKKLPVIIDLQPEPQEVMLRLPEWMKYFFVLLYVATLTGLGLLLRESIDEFKLYKKWCKPAEQPKTRCARSTRCSQSSSTTRAFRGITTFTKCAKSRSPGREQSWNGSPTLISKTQRANTITLLQLGDSASVRVTVEKPITEPIVRVSAAPADYLLQSAGEETPKYNELPKGQKANINNEFTAVVIQLKKQ